MWFAHKLKTAILRTHKKGCKVSSSRWTLRDKLVKHKDCETLWLVLQDCTNDNISRKLHMNHKSSHTRAVWLWKDEKWRGVGVGDIPVHTIN